MCTGNLFRWRSMVLYFQYMYRISFFSRSYTIILFMNVYSWKCFVPVPSNRQTLFPFDLYVYSKLKVQLIQFLVKSPTKYISIETWQAKIENAFLKTTLFWIGLTISPNQKRKYESNYSGQGTPNTSWFYLKSLH